LQISKDDGLPSQICQLCLTNLKLVLRFKSQCESSDLYLRKLQQTPEEDNDSDKKRLEIQPKRTSMGYQCPVCPYGTKSNYFMTDHMKRHDSGLEFFNCENSKLEKYECKKCSFVTDFVVALNEHNKDTHDIPLNKPNNRTQQRKYKQRSYICGRCKFETRSLLQWIRHTQIRCRGEKTEDVCWFECSMCSYRTRTAVNLKSHKLRRHKTQKLKSSNPRHECNKCAYKTEHKSNLQSHMIRHHLALEEIQWHKCEKCDYQGKTRACLCKHYRTHHDCNKWIKCAECEFTAKTKDHLRQHVLSKHTPDHEVEWFKCDHCEYKVKRNFFLMKHLTKRHPKKSKESKLLKYDYKKCNFITDSAVALNEHNTDTHDTPFDKQKPPTTSTPQYKCDKCAYKTDHKRYLQSHNMRNHLDLDLEKIQWHKCDKCEYQGKTKDSLNKHIRTHDSSKWIKCNECEFTAKTKTCLKRHVLAKHTPNSEVQWFECDYCVYRAKWKSSLVHHLTKRHSGETKMDAVKSK
jgi:KRAB domain-containing zinc finger protein